MRVGLDQFDDSYEINRLQAVERIPLPEEQTTETVSPTETPRVENFLEPIEYDRGAVISAELNRRFDAATPDAVDQNALLTQADPETQIAVSSPAPTSREDIVQELWRLARVPRHAIEKLSDAQLAQTRENVLTTLNGPAGQYKLKVGKHDLTLTVNDAHQMADSKTTKPSVWAKIGRIALTVASFIPGPVGIAARIGSAIWSAAEGVKNKNWLQAAVGVAGGVAAGAAALGAKTLAYAANGTANVLRGAQSGFNAIKNRSLLGGLESVAALSGGLADIAGRGAESLTGFAANMQDTARFATGAAQATRAVNSARQGDLFAAATDAFAGAANMSGGPLANPTGERLARYAGYAQTAGVVQASLRSGDYLGASGALTSFASGYVSNENVRQEVRDFGRILSGAGGIQNAVRDRDWLAATASGTEVAAALSRNGSLTEGDLDGASRVLTTATLLRSAVRSGDNASLDLAANQFGNTVTSEVQSFSDRRILQREFEARRRTEMLRTALQPIETRPDLPLLESRDLSFETAAPLQMMTPDMPTPGIGVRADSLRIGSSGQDVAALQERLNQELGIELKVDGKFGPQTEQALRGFQQSRGLMEDGIAGQRTFEQLGIYTIPRISETVNVTANYLPTLTASETVTVRGRQTPDAIPPARGLEFYETKGASKLAYDAVRGDRYEFPDGKVWNVTDTRVTSATGFRAVVLQPEDRADRRVVLAFAGTGNPTSADGIRDWANNIPQALGLEIPPQYSQADRLAREYKKLYGDRLILTGHSLGGGLVSYASMSNGGIPATGVNSAPLSLPTAVIARLQGRPNITHYNAPEIVSRTPGFNPGVNIDVPGNVSIPAIALAFGPAGILIGGLNASVQNHLIDNTAPNVPLPRKVRK